MNPTRNITTYLATTLICAACAAPGSGDTTRPTGTAPQLRTTYVETHPSQGRQRTIEDAKAVLSTDRHGVRAQLSTHGLTAGHAYTLWFVAINRPEVCAASPCKAPDVLANTDATESDVRWAAGGIAGKDGRLQLVGRVPTGPWKSGWFGRGLTNPHGAEIHLVLNDHGPVLAGRERRMTTTYREGCTDESLPPPFPATAKRDGTVGPNKCALVQDAIFVPRG